MRHALPRPNPRPTIERLPHGARSTVEARFAAGARSAHAARFPCTSARLRGGLAALLLATFCLAGCATSRVVGPTAIDELRAVERARVDAMVAADVATLERLFADELQYGHSNGNVQAKPALLATLRDGSLDYLSMRVRSLDVRPYAGGAVATGVADVEATAGPRRLNGALRWLAVYVQRDERWQLVAYQSTSLPP